MVVRVPTADLMSVVPAIVHALMETPLDSMGGASLRQVVNWNERRQEKAVALSKILAEGKSTLPATIGDIYAPYIAAASAIAYETLVDRGCHPLEAIEIVNPATLEMLSNLRDQNPDR